MIRRDHTIARSSRVAGLLTASMYLGIAALVAFGYRSTREWKRSSALLVQRQTEESADLLLTALTRDMRGAQASVLSNRDWGEFSADPPDDASDLAAAAFARYPYPESFFSWQQREQHITFFNRANRPPPWMHERPQVNRYPVVLVQDPPEAALLRDKIDDLAHTRRRYAVFNVQLANQPYQVVARLGYEDPLLEHLETVTGFTVNLNWVRSSYFSDIVTQVGRIGNSGDNFNLAVLDDGGRPVFGQNSDAAIQRDFPLLFLDPSVIIDSPVNQAVPIWRVRVSAAHNSALIQASRSDWTVLIAAGAAVFALAVSLVLMGRTMRASVAVAEMRSDFVSSVTHDLKTPLASIRALADTLVHRPGISSATVHEYGDLLMRETKRLMRLVDNLLAYARVTDVADVYSFEPIEPGELIDDAIRDFQYQLAEGAFETRVEVPADLPMMRADRSAFRLALDNLIDNAIRYSENEKTIIIDARSAGDRIAIEVIDQGHGIPADELSTVRRKFARGRLARADGSGLGLAIVSRVVADHGGSFELESELGRGTVARLLMPIAGD